MESTTRSRIEKKLAMNEFVGFMQSTENGKYNIYRINYIIDFLMNKIEAYNARPFYSRHLNTPHGHLLHYSEKARQHILAFLDAENQSISNFLPSKEYTDYYKKNPIMIDCNNKENFLKKIKHYTKKIKRLSILQKNNEVGINLILKILDQLLYSKEI